MKPLLLAALGLSFCLVTTVPVQAQTLRVLVTNDDGIGAAGIDALVNELSANPNLVIDVVAPAANQSGSTDSLTGAPFTVTSSMTASAYPGLAVDGFPADSVLWALKAGVVDTPDLVVSGINSGQNLTRFVAEDLSGTVGAALTAARNGIPAIAVSQGLVPSDYTAAATYTANVVELFRTKKSLSKKMISKTGVDTMLALNINVPQCNSGAVRGVELVPLKMSIDLLGRNVASYNSTGVDEWQAVLTTDNTFAAQDCESTLEDPVDDLEAFRNGFIAVTPVNPAITVDSKVKKFKLVTKVPFS